MIVSSACPSVLNAHHLIYHNACHAHKAYISLKLKLALLVLTIAGVVDLSDVMSVIKALFCLMVNVYLNV